MRVTFVNRVFTPDEQATAQLLDDLVQGLAARGWTVRVLCGTRADSATAPDNSTPPGSTAKLEVTRLGPPQGRERGWLGRAARHRAFGSAARRWLEANTTGGDIVVFLTDPPLLGAQAGAALLARGARVVHWLQDIYPEVLRVGLPGVLAAAVTCMSRPARDAAWRQAHGLVALSDAAKDYVASRTSCEGRVHRVPNWAPRGIESAPPELVAEQRAAWAVEPDQRVIAYCGNLGRAHLASPLLALARSIEGEQNLRFVVAGGGAGYRWLASELARHGLRRTVLAAPVARERLGALLAAADLHLATLKPEAEPWVWPSKIPGVAAAGRPLVYVGAPDGPVATSMKEIGGVRCFFPGEEGKFVSETKRWLHDAAALASGGAAMRAWHEKQGGVERAIERWDALLRKLATPS